MPIKSSSHSVATTAAINQVLSVTIDATGGTWTFSYNDVPTTDLNYDVSGADATTAADALPGLEPGDLVITDGPGDAGGNTPYTFTFGGNLAGSPDPTVTTDPTNLTGGASTADVAVTTAGVPESPAVRIDTPQGATFKSLHITASGDTAYLGGPDVTSTTGFAIAGTLAAPVNLGDGEALYAICAGGDNATIEVLETSTL